MSSPAISHIGTVVVPVADQDRALAFYRDVLGFEVRIDAPFAEGRRWIEVAPPGAQTSVALVGEGDAIEISLATGDAAGDQAALSTRGADADPLIEMGSGVPPMFTLRDPDGHRLRVVERPDH